MLELELIRTASDYFKVGPGNAAAKLALSYMKSGSSAGSDNPSQ